VTIKSKSGIVYKIDKTSGKIKVKKNKKLKTNKKSKANPFEIKKKKIADKKLSKQKETEKIIKDLKKFENEDSKKILD